MEIFTQNQCHRLSLANSRQFAVFNRQTRFWGQLWPPPKWIWRNTNQIWQKSIGPEIQFNAQTPRSNPAPPSRRPADSAPGAG